MLFDVAHTPSWPAEWLGWSVYEGQVTTPAHRRPLADYPTTRTQQTLQVTTAGVLAAALLALVLSRHHGRHLAAAALALLAVGVVGQVFVVVLRVHQRRRDEAG